MQLDLPFLLAPALPDPPKELSERIEFVRLRKARRYILRVRPDGTLRVTIPRGGSRAEAVAFMARHLEWVARERARVGREQAPARWTHGTAVLFSGQPHSITIEETAAGPIARLANVSAAVRDVNDVRPDLERALRNEAREQLLPRLRQLADAHRLAFSKATIRSQRARWGSCSRAGAIALNYRLIQMPAVVRDYVLIHELMHLKQQNHGPRFWALVEAACPTYREAERWLRPSGRRLF